MYVCLCRQLTDRHVEAACQGGARTARCVFRSCSVQPKCGKCVAYIHGMVAEQSRPAPSVHNDARA